MVNPLYDITQSFKNNFFSPISSHLTIPNRRNTDPQHWLDFLGFKIASRLGVSACAITIGKFIPVLAKLGFDVLTYKTIRSRAWPAHPLPNIVYLNEPKLTVQNLQQSLVATNQPNAELEKIAISNSFGNACFEPEITANDIATAKKSLSKGQILIVSVYGEAHGNVSIEEDYAAAAILAKNSGADIIELNLSCPNIESGHGLVYTDSQLVYRITKKVTDTMVDTPVIIKIGLFSEGQSVKETLISAAKAGARGVCAINSVSMRVLNITGEPVFGANRVYSGVSGFPIHDLAVKFIEEIIDINIKEKLNLRILATGGATKAEDLKAFLNRGADIAMTATGVMWNPYMITQSTMDREV